MKIAVITPYYRETRHQLSRCIDSVFSQQIKAEHFLIADGYPQPNLQSFGVRHIVLDKNHNDFGNTPRAIGGLIAVAEGFDTICFLDADNWLDKHHFTVSIETIRRASAAPDYIICRRRWVRMDGSVLNYQAQEDADGSHVDTNCIILLEGGLHAVARWGLIPKFLSSVGDRIFVHGLRSERLISAINDQITVNYLCTWSNVFQNLNEPVPEYAKSGIDILSIKDRLRKMSSKEREFLVRRIGFSINFIS
jgi:hypothetical protein